MALEIRHVADFNGLQFRIPSYQRGYRWEKKQIEELLDDLLEFSNNLKSLKLLDMTNSLWNNQHPNQPQKKTNNLDDAGFYCLQPLAINSNNVGTLDLIDGQQRLTTIYLILEYLGCHIYDLSYESRDDIFFTKNQFKNGTSNAIANIDFYFMAKAYETIGSWFVGNPNTKNDIQEILIPQNFYGTNSQFRPLDDNLHDVRFIWYETTSGSSIQIFNNLNYGKISLTDPELVKALFFQCDYSRNVPVAKNKANLRSVKWSQMEEYLQDEFFWGMLTPQNYVMDLHLELILRFVAKVIVMENKYQIQHEHLFSVFSKAVSDTSFVCDGVVVSDIEDRIEKIWNKVVNVYTVFHNWYENRIIYHHIGLLVFLTCNYDCNKNGVNMHEEIIEDLFDRYSKCIKSDFFEYLRKKIGEKVAIRTTTQSGRPKHLNEIMYEDDSEAVEIRKILILFNVVETLNNQQEMPRFPFHLANKFKVDSLEHIHPQNLDVDDITYEDLKTWFEERVSVLNSNGVLADSGKTVLQAAVTQLQNNLVSVHQFETNKAQCLLDLQDVDKEFDELVGMSPDIMHSLYNMALVDKETNSALQNGLLDKKRDKLKERSDNGETYVPIGTWHVFNKYYSSDVKDLKFWSKSDRNAYFKQIENIYNQYTR